MAAPKRTEFERERDLDRIADLRLEEYTQQQIADIIGVSRQQIASDLKELERRWYKASIEKVEMRKARQLAEIRKMKRHAWKMLHKTDRELYDVLKEEGSRDGVSFERIQKKVSESASDSKWAAIWLSCLKREAELTGMDSPSKIAITDTAGKDVELSPEECARQAAGMLQKMRERLAAKAAGAIDAADDEDEDEGGDEP